MFVATCALQWNAQVECWHTRRQFPAPEMLITCSCKPPRVCVCVCVCADQVLYTDSVHGVRSTLPLAKDDGLHVWRWHLPRGWRRCPPNGPTGKPRILETLSWCQAVPVQIPVTSFHTPHLLSALQHGCHGNGGRGGYGRQGDGWDDVGLGDDLDEQVTPHDAGPYQGHDRLCAG